MRVLSVVVLILLVVGGINWGLVGFFDYNLVDELFGEGSTVARIVYGVVGVAAVYKLFYWVAQLASGKKA